MMKPVRFCLFVVALGSAGAWAQFGLEVLVLPSELDDATPATVMISASYPNTCFEACNVSVQWIDPRHVRLERSVRRGSGPSCFPTLTEVVSQTSLGALSPGVYTITVSESFDTFDPFTCLQDKPFTEREGRFCVSSSCAGKCGDGNACTLDTCADVDAGQGCVHHPVLVRYGDLTDDGVVDVDDIICSLDGFSGFFECPCSSDRTDIAPCGGNGVTDVDDIVAVLDTFLGYLPCGEDCPSPSYCLGTFGEVCPAACAAGEVCAPNLVELDASGRAIAALGCSCRSASFCHLEPGLPGESPQCIAGCGGFGGSCAAEALVDPDSGHAFVGCDCFSPQP